MKTKKIRDWYWKVPFSGVVAFMILHWLLNSPEPIAIFLATFTAFLVTGPYIFNTDSFERVERFASACITVSIILFAISLIGIAFKIFGWPDIIDIEICKAFVWPTFTVSIVLFIVSSFGLISLIDLMGSIGYRGYGGMYE